MKTELRSNTSTSIPLQNSSFSDTPQSSISGALKGCLGSLDGACIEKLLLHCASALESNDGTLAQQVMWVLNNVASVVGDPNQRLTSWFLRALISRASTWMNLDGSSSFQRRKMSVTELAGYVDLIPWHRFGFCASNGAIIKAIEGYQKVHILDFSITHCMQWPTLIDALGKRPEGPPSLRITVPSFRPPVPPFLNVSTEEVGLRLSNFAKYRDVPFEFKAIDASPRKQKSGFSIEMLLSQLTPSLLNLQNDEALVVNCQNWLRYLSDGTISLRHDFVQTIKGLNPSIVVIVDEDSDLSAPCLSSRITTCFNYLWIPFDALETLLPRDSCQRIEYESDIGHKIENIISYEGFQRIERLESGSNQIQRMRNAGFVSVQFCEETVKQMKSLLDEHASGWGMKREEEMLVLTWKGHNSVFATAWIVSGLED
ncbi:scarecrow-like protein 32 [Euphorbia lathyris]|uniref:scarecrow-like protein 32 n=1 Tax=Euphorbia lathyris TaxID=212925 RepID=UPI0033132088